MIESQISRCSDLPEGRASGVCFVVNDTAYLFGGRDAQGAIHNDLWRYNAGADTWEELGPTPLKPRVKPTVCVVGNNVYIGLGAYGKVSRDTTYLQDYWQYDAIQHAWTRLADYPSSQTVAAVSLPQEDKIYVCYGIRDVFERDVFAYDISNNSWQQVADDTPRNSNHPPRVSGPVGAVCEGRLFLGTGHHTTSRNFWTELTPDESDIWHEQQSLPGRGRNSAVAATSTHYIYIAGGRRFGGTVTDGEVYSDILRYAPAKNSWARVGFLPCGSTENMQAFFLNGSVYMVGGNDSYNNVRTTVYQMSE